MREVRTPLDVTRHGFAAWNSGDLDAFLEVVHPEIKWVTSGVFPGLRSSYSGHDGIREFWRAFQEPWESLEIELERSAEVDADSVLVLVHFHARGRDGIETDRRMANHLTVRDGKLFRRVYADWDHALAELGVEDPRDG
jgi:ketosteroid isomerase-like protein